MLNIFNRFFQKNDNQGNFFEYYEPSEKEYNYKNAYKDNVIVYRCTNLIAQSAAHVPFILYNSLKKVRYNDHPIARLLKRPNSRTAGAEFFEKVIAHKLLFGNAFILLTNNTKKQGEFFLLAPQNMEICYDDNDNKYYKYETANKVIKYPVDNISGKSNILHLKNYNPYSDIYGMSCLDAASSHIELHTQATKWNNSLLKNGARPSGALIMRHDSGYLSDEQFHRLKEQLNEKYSGSRNSGKPLLLEGGLDWREMSMNPKDMDFMESKSSAAREIALAFGVPPQLLGIAGDNTYSNMQEARLALWEETLIPLLDNLTDALSNWLTLLTGEDLQIDFDRDSISALSERRENVWAKISTANFMTINEKRSLVGLPPVENGHKFIFDRDID